MSCSIGHVVLSDGRNVTKGDRLVYDLTSGQAAVQGGGSRVQGLFLPGPDPTSGGEEEVDRDAASRSKTLAGPCDARA